MTNAQLISNSFDSLAVSSIFFIIIIFVRFWPIFLKAVVPRHTFSQLCRN